MEAAAGVNRTPEVIKGGLWTTWQTHRRSRELANALGLDLHEITSRRRRPWKYFELSAKTTRLWLQRRPSLVFVQCPSVFLALLAVLLKPVLRYQLVCDLHNEAVRPFLHDTGLHRVLLRWIWRRADLNLVTNDGLKQVVERAGGAAFVLPDRVPVIRGEGAGDSQPDGKSVVFVCTYQADEPFREVIEAGALLPSGVHLYVTGRHKGVENLPPLPPNVSLTGYLSDYAYDRLLIGAEVIVDLTAMEDCLVCGAYETAALGKPLVTSDTAALRSYFHSGTVYTQHTPEAIAAAIQSALDDRDVLSLQMRQLASQLEEDWQARHSTLVAMLNAGSESSLSGG